MSGSERLRRLRRAGPERLALQRALRCTLAACVGFYVFRYGLGDPVAATYALFSAVSLGVLSHLVGGPRQRTATLVAALPVAALLVTAGTLLAGNAWAAAAGMAVVGFAVVLSRAGGPRPAGIVPGLQLFYILPCFPPYAPETLDSRLTGLVVGVVLLAAADRLLWPEPAPPPYTHRLAEAAAATAEQVDAVARAAGGDAVPAARLATAREGAEQATLAARPESQPEGERPWSPAAADRAAVDAAGALRVAQSRVDRVQLMLRAGQRYPASAALLSASAGTLRLVSEGLATGRAPRPGGLADAQRRFERERLQLLTEAAAEEAMLVDRVRVAGTAAEVADAVGVVRDAAAVAAGERPAGSGLDPAGSAVLSYASRSTAALWWARLRLHLTPRSVTFENAVRTAVALAGARLLATALDLTHGFWVGLATLTLMRTSAADTRTAFGPAVRGTLAGAVVSAALLVVVGPYPMVAEIGLPFVMTAAFAAGPLLGAAWAQALFTVTIALIFSQVAPATWRLAEARLVDVLVGGAIGILIGLVAWPRGGGAQLKRATADGLDAGAAVLAETVRSQLHGTGRAEPTRTARAALRLTEEAYAQTRGERTVEAVEAVDWQGLTLLVQRIVRGAEQLDRRYPTPYQVPWPAVVGLVDRTATELESATTGLAGQLRGPAAARRPARGEEGPAGPARPAAEQRREAASQLRAALLRGDGDRDVLRVLDVEAWLVDLGADVRRAGQQLAGRSARTGPAGADAPTADEVQPAVGRPREWG